MGAFLSSINAGRAPPSQIIDVMSIYHPFPLRLDSLNKGAPVQYDACLQLGEFPSDKYKGNSAVVLFPLKVNRNPGAKGKFMDGIATKIPTILGQQPDPINGYPDVPAHTGADWSIEDILFMQNSAGETVSRAFYAWINKTPFPVGVVVMAEPVYISQTNMDAIKRLPITPPSDVIHEIGTPILYKPGPIFDEEGNPQPCPATKAEMAKQAMNSIRQPPVPDKKGGIDLDLFFQIVLGTLATVIVILGVWAGIKLALGPGSKVMKSLGDSLGRSLAGGYEAIKKAKLPTVPAIPQSVKDSVNKTRRKIGNRLGLGPKGQDPDDILPVLKPEKDIEITNPLFKSKDDFLKFQERNRTRRNIDRQKPKKGTIGAITNLPSKNIPVSAPAPSPAPAPAPAPSPSPAPAPSPSPAPAPAPSPSPAPAPAPSPSPAPAPAPAPSPAPAPAPAPAPPPGRPNKYSRTKTLRNTLSKLSAAQKAKKSLGQVRAVREIDSLRDDDDFVSYKNPLYNKEKPKSEEPKKEPKRDKFSRTKTLRNTLSKLSAAQNAKKSLGQVRAIREIDSLRDDDSVSYKNPLYNKEKPKSEVKTEEPKKEPKKEPVNARWTKMLENKNKNSQQKSWNPSTKINSPSRLGKGRKRRNRRKTGHHLRNRKKTGRKI